MRRRERAAARGGLDDDHAQAEAANIPIALREETGRRGAARRDDVPAVGRPGMGFPGRSSPPPPGCPDLAVARTTGVVLGSALGPMARLTTRGLPAEAGSSSLGGAREVAFGY
jgi:hypothetical protein